MGSYCLKYITHLKVSDIHKNSSQLRNHHWKMHAQLCVFIKGAHKENFKGEINANLVQTFGLG